jgi:large subunit ribosomal protein L21
MTKADKYVIIKLNGKQIKVTEGDVIEVDKIDEKDLNAEVLLAVDGEKVTVGHPVLDKVSVKIKPVEDIKGKKVRVFKYKSKSRYRKTMGFRPQLSKIQIDKITF